MPESARALKAVPDPLPESSLESFVARQPIFDRRLEVVGYELLFRNRPEDDSAFPLPVEATSKTIVAAFTEIGIEAIVGRRTAYVNATRDFLVDEQARVLPPSRVALEVLEDVALDPDVLSSLRALGRSGYRIVLDDFAWKDGLEEALEIVHGVKIEANGRDETELGDLVEQLSAFGLDLVAEKVETHEELELCRALGFTHFQGNFLSRPRIVGVQSIPADKLSKMQLVALLQDDNADIDDLEQVIARDIGLSFRLLRYLNSAYFYLPRRVTSVRDAILILGPRSIRRWATLIALADIDDQPAELVVTAMVRAKMCELLASTLERGDPDSSFTVGLFSVVDAILGVPMGTLVSRLPFSAALQMALVEGSGDLGEVLRCVLAYENGDFEEVLRVAPDGAPLTGAYLEAIGWADRSRAELVG